METINEYHKKKDYSCSNKQDQILEPGEGSNLAYPVWVRI